MPAVTTLSAVFFSDVGLVELDRRLGAGVGAHRDRTERAGSGTCGRGDDGGAEHAGDEAGDDEEEGGCTKSHAGLLSETDGG